MINGDTKIVVDLINSRIDGVERQIERQIDKLDNKITDKVHNHCLRIRVLEKISTIAKTKMGLASMVISGSVSFAVAIILIFVSKNWWN